MQVVRQNVQDILFETHGLTHNQVSEANDKGGTSNDGKYACSLFSKETIENIVRCVASG